MRSCAHESVYRNPGAPVISVFCHDADAEIDNEDKQNRSLFCKPVPNS